MLLLHCLLVHIAVCANLHADLPVAHLHLLPNQTESDQLADLDHDHTPTRLPDSAEAYKAVVVGGNISAFMYVYGWNASWSKAVRECKHWHRTVKNMILTSHISPTPPNHAVHAYRGV